MTDYIIALVINDEELETLEAFEDGATLANIDPVITRILKAQRTPLASLSNLAGYSVEEKIRAVEPVFICKHCGVSDGYFLDNGFRRCNTCGEPGK